MSKNILFLCIFLLPSLLFSQKRQLKKLKAGKVLPPNCVQIDDNLYMDKSEVSNIDFREYTYWTNVVFPNKVSSCLPDTLEWNADSINSCVPLSEVYFRHDGFKYYPVVGLTWQQAKDYCQWRSDRVYEMILIEAGIIKMNPKQDSSSYFSIENYLSGNYLNYKPDSSIPIPRFHLPSEAEWMKAAAASLSTSDFPYGYDLEHKKLRKAIKKQGKQNLFNTIEHKKYKFGFGTDTPDCYLKLPIPVLVNSIKNDFGIYHLIGNVAEMTDQKGIAKGGSYKTPFAEATVLDKQLYDAPAVDLGFRCAVYWEFLK